MAPRNAPKGNWWDDLLPGSTPAASTSSSPRTPSEEEFREAKIMAERAKANAAAVGIPTSTSQEILSTGQRPDTGFATWIPGLKAIGGTAKKVAGAILPDVLDVSDIPLPGTDKNLGEGVRASIGATARAVAPVLKPPYRAYQTGLRFTLGLIKELDEELSVQAEKLPGVGGIKRGQKLYYPSGRERGEGGFQWSEVLKVTRDPNAGFGNTVWSDVTGNPYIDQTVGFLGEIFVDPVNLLSAGVGGTALKSASKAAGLAPDAFRATSVINEALQAQGRAAMRRELALEALENARAAGATVDELARAEDVVKAATKELNLATTNVAGPKAPRVRGRSGAAALAQRLVDERNAAQRVIDGAAANPARYSPDQVGLARYTVEVFNDDLIAKTASRGYAGLIPGIKQAFSGPTPAESLLGVSGRLRLGFGDKMFEIPGTGRITRPITYGTQALRQGTAARVGIGGIVPTGEGGLFQQGLRRERAALRSGALEGAGDQATKNLEFERLDTAFRGNRVRFVRDTVSTLARYGLTRRFQPDKLTRKIRNIAKALGKDIPADAGFTKADLNSVLPFVTDATKRAAAEPTLGASQKKALAAIEGALSDFYRQAQEIAGQTGRDLGFIPNYFPQMLSDEALAAIRKGGKPASDAAKNLKISDLEARGNFTSRTLNEGDEFFGVELTAEDIAGGVVRLNEIARAGGWKYGNFFEEDVLTVLLKYANRHADDMARQTTLAQAPALAPEQFARELETSKTLVIKDFDAARAKSSFRKYAEKKAATVKDADTAAIATLIDNLDKSIDEIVTAGFSDDAALVMQDGLLRAANLDLNEILYGVKDSPFELDLKRFSTEAEIMNRGFVSIGDAAPDIYADPRVLELFRTVKTVTGNPDYAKALLRLYDGNLGMIKAYMLATPRQVGLNLLGNYHMMTLAAGAKLKNLAEGFSIYRQIAKMAKDGVPIDDAVRMVASKLQPRGALERIAGARRLPSEAEEALMISMGMTPPRARMAATGEVMDMIEKAVADAYALYGGAGFGRYGEIGAEIGADVARPGVLLRGPAKGVSIPREINLPGGYRSIPLRPSDTKLGKKAAETTVGKKVTKAKEAVAESLPGRAVGKATELATTGIGFVTRKGSEAVGAVPANTRRVAQAVEDSQRFQFMWDGLRQGLTPEEAAARVKFYLFDYQDYSKLDQAGRRLFPFWMWMSRNTPLQLVLGAYNPRAYAIPEKFRRATEQRGAQEYGTEEYEPLPSYLVGRGGYVTKEMEGFGAPFSRITIDPGLPIVGFGEKNFFTEFLDSYESGLIGPLTPAVRIPLELYANRIAAFRDPIVYDNDVDPTSKRIEYAFRQSFGMPISLFSRYVASVEPLRRREFVQTAFDLRYDENQPGDQAIGSAFRILGLPFQPLPRESVKASVVKNNTRELENFTKDVEEGKLREEEQQIEQGGEPVAPSTGGNWWDDLIPKENP